MDQSTFVIVLIAIALVGVILVASAVRGRGASTAVTAEVSPKDADLLGRRVAYRRNRRALRRGAPEFGAAIVTGFRWRWREGRLKLLAELEEVTSGTRFCRALSELGV